MRSKILVITELFTSIYFHSFYTCIAIYSTTPMEFALTTFFNYDLLSIVTSTAAHERASVDTC